MDIEKKLYLVRYQPDKESHLNIAEPAICREKCRTHPCTHFCPARVYVWDDSEEKIHTAYEGCLECGTCLYGCPYDNIDWGNPRGGFGVAYKFG